MLHAAVSLPCGSLDSPPEVLVIGRHKCQSRAASKPLSPFWKLFVIPACSQKQWHAEHVIITILLRKQQLSIIRDAACILMTLLLHGIISYWYLLADIQQNPMPRAVQRARHPGGGREPRRAVPAIPVQLEPLRVPPGDA